MSLDTRDTEDWTFKAFGPKDGIQTVPSCRRYTAGSSYHPELLAISPNGELFAAGSPSDEGTLVLGKLSSLHSALVENAKEIANLKTIERPGIVRVHFLANGRQIVVFVEDNTVELYDVPSLNLITSLRSESLAYSSVFSTKQGFVFSEFSGQINVIADNESTSVQTNSPVFCVKKSDDTLVYADELELPSIAGKVFWMGEISPGQLAAVAQDTSEEDVYKLFIQNGAGLDEWLCVEEACPVFDSKDDEVCWFTSSVPSFPSENQYTTIAACSMSTEMLLLTSEAKLRVMDDSDKLPFTTDDEDIITVGACLDLSDSTDVISPINGIDSASHLPLWLVLTQEGRLLAWHVVSKSAISNKIELHSPKAAEAPDLTLISAVEKAEKITTQTPISEEEVDELSEIETSELQSPGTSEPRSLQNSSSESELPLESSISDDASEDGEAPASQEAIAAPCRAAKEYLGPPSHSKRGQFFWLSEPMHWPPSSAPDSSLGLKPSRLADTTPLNSGGANKSPFSSALNSIGSDKEKFSGFSKQLSGSVSGKSENKSPVNSSSPFAEFAKLEPAKSEVSPFAEFAKDKTPVSDNIGELTKPENKLPLELSQSQATEIGNDKPTPDNGEQETAPGQQNSVDVPANKSPFASETSQSLEVREQTSPPITDSAKGDDSSASATNKREELPSGNLKTLVNKHAQTGDLKESKADVEKKGEAISASTEEDTSPQELDSKKEAQDKVAAESRAAGDPRESEADDESEGEAITATTEEDTSPEELGSEEAQDEVAAESRAAGDPRESEADDENEGEAITATTEEDTSPKLLGSEEAQDKVAAETRAADEKAKIIARAEAEAKHATEIKQKEDEKARFQAEAELVAEAKRKDVESKALAEEKKKRDRITRLTSTEWIGEIGTQFAQLKDVLQDSNLKDLVDFDAIYGETNILFQVVDQNLQVLEGNDEYEITKLSEELDALSADGFNARGDISEDGPHIADLLSIMKKYNASVADLKSIKDSTSSLSDLGDKLTDDVEQLKDECLRANAELEALETQISEEAFYLRPLSIESVYRKKVLQDNFTEAVALLKNAKRSALSLMLSNSRPVELGNLIVAIDTIDSRLSGLEKQITRLKAAQQSSCLSNSLAKLTIQVSHGQSSPARFRLADDKRPKIQSSMLLHERINAIGTQLSMLETRSAEDIMDCVDF